MFTVGLGYTMDLFFAASSMLIAIPTGVKVLNWSATLFRGRIRFDRRCSSASRSSCSFSAAA
jgi:heme/copper-type cytochrome/quinol oxidase subunit 1